MYEVELVSWVNMRWTRKGKTIWVIQNIEAALSHSPR